jgi:hypothetical protein
MKAICASVNFDRSWLFPVQRPESHVPLNWNFPAIIGPENRKQVIQLKTNSIKPAHRFIISRYGTLGAGARPERCRSDCSIRIMLRRLAANSSS